MRPVGEDLTQDWNVVVTVRDDGYTRVRHALKQLGVVDATSYYNVLVMRVDDIARLLEQLDELIEEDPWVAEDVSRILPVTHTFSFEDSVDFEARAREVIGSWLGELAGRSFHVRMHARGWTESISRHEEEHRLATALVRALDLIGQDGEVAFDDADVVIDVETIAHRAGMAMWTRHQLDEHRFLRID